MIIGFSTQALWNDGEFVFFLFFSFKLCFYWRYFRALESGIEIGHHRNEIASWKELPKLFGEQTNFNNIFEMFVLNNFFERRTWVTRHGPWVQMDVFAIPNAVSISFEFKYFHRIDYAWMLCSRTLSNRFHRTRDIGPGGNLTQNKLSLNKTKCSLFCMKEATVNWNLLKILVS